MYRFRAKVFLKKLGLLLLFVKNISLNVMPHPPEKLAKGFRLPLLKHIQLSDPVLQIHKVSALSGARRISGGG